MYHSKLINVSKPLMFSIKCCLKCLACQEALLPFLFSVRGAISGGNHTLHLPLVFEVCPHFSCIFPGNETTACHFCSIPVIFSWIFRFVRVCLLSLKTDKKNQQLPHKNITRRPCVWQNVFFLSFLDLYASMMYVASLLVSFSELYPQNYLIEQVWQKYSLVHEPQRNFVTK